MRNIFNYTLGYTVLFFLMKRMTWNIITTNRKEDPPSHPISATILLDSGKETELLLAFIS